MKILRKGDDFKKVKDSTFDDLKKLNSFLNDGWNYSPKKDYKEAFGKAKKNEEVKDDAKKDKKEKKSPAPVKSVEKKVDKKKVDKKKKK